MKKINLSFRMAEFTLCLLIGGNIGPATAVAVPAIGAAVPAIGAAAPAEAAAIADALVQQRRLWTYRGRFFEERRDVIGVTSYDANVLSANILIDFASGAIVHYADDTPFKKPSSGRKEVSADGALAAAQAFALRAGARLQDWTLDQTVYLDHGTGGQNYEFNWRKHYFGVRMPAVLDIFVDAWSGAVTEYSLIDEALTVPIQPHITAEQAVAAVAQRMGYVQPVVGRVQLTVWYTAKKPGPERLYWSLESMRDRSVSEEDWNKVMSADVDAVTGQIVTIAVPMGIRFSHTDSHSPRPRKSGNRPLATPPHILHLQSPLPLPLHALPPDTTFQMAEKARVSGRAGPGKLK